MGTTCSLAADRSDVYPGVAVARSGTPPIVGFSMGSGELGRYLGTYGSERVAKAVFLASLEPYLLPSEDNPEGVPQNVFDGLFAAMQADRYAFFTHFFAGFFSTEEFLGNRLSQEALDADQQLAYNASPHASTWA